MDILILLIYASAAICVFKIFKLRVTGYSVLTTVLGGVGFLAALLLTMNYNHPYSSMGRFYYHTTPIVPEVRGKVIEVAVSDEQHVREGEVLFKIDPVPFTAAVDKRRAELVAARQHVEEFKSNVVAFEEAHKASIARRDVAEDTYDRTKRLFSQEAATEAAMVSSRQEFFESSAEVSRAKAELARVKLQAESAIDGVHTAIASAEASLASAEFELQQTTVRAPTDGAVQQVLLRPGMMAVPLPLKPVMVFQHDESRFFVASFLQNNAQRIAEGREAEAIFPAVPGRVFKGKVKLIGAVIAEGQLQPSGEMVDAEKIVGGGRINVVIEFGDGALDGFRVIPGSNGQVAVYSSHTRSIGVIRQILLKMTSWTNFVFSDGL